MKPWFSRSAVLLLFATLAMAQAGESHPGHRQERFVGAWRLVSLEEPDADGTLHTADCSGLLVYTSDGHMSVQVMYHNPARGQAASAQYAQNGYEASFGEYEINDAHTFTFHVEGAMVRTLVGKKLPRAYEFAGNRMIVKSTDLSEHWRATWERY